MDAKSAITIIPALSQPTDLCEIMNLEDTTVSIVTPKQIIVEFRSKKDASIEALTARILELEQEAARTQKRVETLEANTNTNNAIAVQWQMVYTTYVPPSFKHNTNCNLAVFDFIFEGQCVECEAMGFTSCEDFQNSYNLNNGSPRAQAAQRIYNAAAAELRDAAKMAKIAKRVMERLRMQVAHPAVSVGDLQSTVYTDVGEVLLARIADSKRKGVRRFIA
ncbi:hypothetical protein B0H11DRAFT_1949442 [Mycena galericulata]|nr:hypothetical protein B0H11DRAFT_1949442 [Mycena galericulata]